MKIETVFNLSNGYPVDCFPVLYAGKYTSCITKTRIALVHSSVSYTTNRNMNSLKYLLKLGSTRRLIENHSQSALFTNFRLWAFDEILHGTLLKNFEKTVGRIYDSGLFNMFLLTFQRLNRRKYTRYVRTDKLCNSSRWNQTEQNCTPMSVGSDQVASRIRRDTIEPILVTYLLLLLVSLVVLSFEKYWSDRVKFNEIY